MLEGGSKEKYLEAKRASKGSVHAAKETVEENEFDELKPGMNESIRLLSR